MALESSHPPLGAHYDCTSETKRMELQEATDGIHTVGDLYAFAEETKNGDLAIHFPYFYEAFTLAIDENTGERQLLGYGRRLQRNDVLTPEICLALTEWIREKYSPLPCQQCDLEKYGVRDFRELAYDFLRMLMHRDDVS